MPQDLMAALEQHAAPFASALIWIKAIRICVCHAALVNRALVVGGTGDLGRAVARSLREHVGRCGSSAGDLPRISNGKVTSTRPAIFWTLLPCERPSRIARSFTSACAAARAPRTSTG